MHLRPHRRLLLPPEPRVRNQITGCQRLKREREASLKQIKRRSAQVAAPLLAAAALALTGCRKQEMQRCVDENNHVVDDKLCASEPQAERRPDGHGGFLFIPMPYRYYYGGYGGYAPGAVVGGGAYTPTPGRSYAMGTSRGGFGGTLGGGSEGGGEGGAGE